MLGRTSDVSTGVVRALGVAKSASISNKEILKAVEKEIKNINDKLAKCSHRRGQPRRETKHRVALELARLYAKVTGERPTYADGANGVSGKFTPALVDVFRTLGWRSGSLKGPAVNAIKSITDEDLMP